MRALPAPPAVLAGCPPSTDVLPAALFSVLPAECFGGRDVRISAWLGVRYLIGGWEAPWSIEPAWLWPMKIGRLVLLLPDSDASRTYAVLPHFRPGTELKPAAVDRWVVVRGHYAVKEAAACRYVYFAGYDPAVHGPRLDDAGARAECRRAFVVVSIVEGQPG